VLIVGLLIGVTASALRPGIRAAGRDGNTSRLATRQIAQTLARAVRELSGADTHKPAIHSQNVLAKALGGVDQTADLGDKPNLTVPLLRDALLALPPPTV